MKSPHDYRIAGGLSDKFPHETVPFVKITRSMSRVNTSLRKSFLSL